MRHLLAAAVAVACALSACAAHRHPNAQLPELARTVLDEREDGQIRYAALESLRWYDTPEAIETLERINETLTDPEDAVLRLQIEGAINQVRQRMEASRRRAAVRDDAEIERDSNDERFRLAMRDALRRIREEEERERRVFAPPPE